jgi:CubicO group peptidase (beta-lactamase class C family)
MAVSTGLRDAWRTAPANRQAFHKVQSFLPTDTIANDPRDVWRLDTAAKQWRASLLQRSLLWFTDTDALVVLSEGQICFEYYSNGNCRAQPHILMSGSKAVIGLLLGLLVNDGQIDDQTPIERYIPDLADTRYAGSTARDLADMRAGVSLNADEQKAYDIATNWEAAADTPPAAHLKAFFESLKGAPAAHGGGFRYISAHTDLLGWVIERATGRKVAELLSEKIWRPMGAEAPAYLTLDQDGMGRSAGGIGCCARDFARLGLLLLHGGRRGGGQVIPRSLVDDLWDNADRAAWANGDWAKTLAPISRQMAYRGGWYVVDEEPSRLFAMGIHGQNLFVDRERDLVVAKFSSWRKPSAPLPFVVTHRAFSGLQRYVSK